MKIIRICWMYRKNDSPRLVGETLKWNYLQNGRRLMYVLWTFSTIIWVMAAFGFVSWGSSHESGYEFRLWKTKKHMRYVGCIFFHLCVCSFHAPVKGPMIITQRCPNQFPVHPASCLSLKTFGQSSTSRRTYMNKFFASTAMKVVYFLLQKTIWFVEIFLCTSKRVSKRCVLILSSYACRFATKPGIQRFRASNIYTYIIIYIYNLWSFRCIMWLKQY